MITPKTIITVASVAAAALTLTACGVASPQASDPAEPQAIRSSAVDEPSSLPTQAAPSASTSPSTAGEADTDAPEDPATSTDDGVRVTSGTLTQDEILRQLPADTLDQTPEAAAKLLGFYLNLEYAMHADPYDTRLFTALSLNDCAYCRDALAQVAVSAYSSVTYTTDGCQWEDVAPGTEEGYMFIESDGSWLISQVCDGTTVAVSRPGVSDAETAVAPACATGRVGWNGTNWMIGDVAMGGFSDCPWITEE
ncbi:hypothetical protein [Demequina globuliformis]|uniref:hypothetical protein n=1 Tax=Demequina globuliformis TaxID=676202 RepID=UPI000784E585|nr:hypothetical protein [Demequina globuliformis]